MCGGLRRSPLTDLAEAVTDERARRLALVGRTPSSGPKRAQRVEQHRVHPLAPRQALTALSGDRRGGGRFLSTFKWNARERVAASPAGRSLVFRRLIGLATVAARSRPKNQSRAPFSVWGPMTPVAGPLRLPRKSEESVNQEDT